MGFDEAFLYRKFTIFYVRKLSKYINQIFDPYFTTKEKGSGIGLYMSEMIIKNHFKGKIIACNKANGSLFTIEF